MICTLFRIGTPFYYVLTSWTSASRRTRHSNMAWMSRRHRKAQWRAANHAPALKRHYFWRIQVPLTSPSPLHSPWILWSHLAVTHATSPTCTPPWWAIRLAWLVSVWKRLCTASTGPPRHCHLCFIPYLIQILFLMLGMKQPQGCCFSQVMLL